MGMRTPPNHMRRVVVAATSATALLVLGLITLLGHTNSGSEVELAQLHAVQQPAIHSYVSCRSPILSPQTHSDFTVPGKTQVTRRVMPSYPAMAKAIFTLFFVPS